MKRIRSNGLLSFLALSLAIIAVGAFLGYRTAEPIFLPVSFPSQVVEVSPSAQTYYEFVETFSQETSLSDESLRGLSVLAGLYCLIWCIALLIKKTTQTKNVLTSIGFFIITFLIAGVFGYGFIALLKSLGFIHAEAATKLFILTIVSILSAFLIVPTAAIRAKSKQTVLIGGMLLYCLLNTIFAFAQCHMAYLFSIPVLSTLIYSVLIRYNNQFNSSKLLQIVYIELSGTLIVMIYTPVVLLLRNTYSPDMIIMATQLVVSSVLPICIMAAACMVGKADKLPEETPDTLDEDRYNISFFESAEVVKYTIELIDKDS
ncbi:MAG: hypothetical protein ACOX1Q_05150 [Eubacteriales bacterium]|jgi:hypothetical protein